LAEAAIFLGIPRNTLNFFASKSGIHQVYIHIHILLSGSESSFDKLKLSPKTTPVQSILLFPPVHHTIFGPQRLRLSTGLLPPLLIHSRVEMLIIKATYVVTQLPQVAWLPSIPSLLPHIVLSVCSQNPKP
jgi:hypothetical protein